MTNSKLKSHILAEVHETVTGQRQAGVISKRRMHEYDALSNLAVPTIGANKIKLIRENSRLSQAVSAAVLNTSVSTVQK